MTAVLWALLHVFGISAVSLGAEPSNKAPDNFILPAVVVTSQGADESYLQTPVRIDTLSRDTLAKDKPRFIGDSLERVSGVYIREVNPLVPALGIRLPANFESPYYLATIDGIPLLSSMNITHHSISRLPIATASGGLEVMKGTSSVLYGSDAISAVINLKSPDFADERRASVELGQRNFQSYKASSTQSFGDQSYYVIGNYTKDDGWREKQVGQKGEMIAKHRVKLASGATVTTTLIANVIDIQQAGYLNHQTYLDNPRASGLSVDDPYSKTNYARLTSEFKFYLGDSTQISITPYLRYDGDKTVAFWDTSTLPLDTSSEKTLGLRGLVKHVRENSESIFGLDLEVTSFSYKEEQTAPTVAGATPAQDLPKGVHYDYDVTYTKVSPFASQTWFLSKNWRWDLGLRADFDRYAYANRASDGTCDTSANAGGRCGNFLRAENRSDSFSNVSPKTGIGYQIDKIQSVYANSGMGYKIPTVTTLYNLVSGQESSGLKAEKSQIYELGYKIDNGRVGFDLSIYQMDILDRLVQTQGTGLELSTYSNAGRSRHRGIELGGAVKLSSELSLDLSAALTTNKFVDYTTNGVSYSGKNESQAPSRVYDAQLNYQPRFLPRLAASIEWNHIGSYWVEDANVNRQPGHEMFNFRASYRALKSLNLTARIMNLTDVKYPSDVANFGSLNYRPGMPFTAYAGVEYSL
jgi:outer membrane receptor protein involved in Fe transport